MINFKSSSFQTSTNDSYHDESFVFTEEKGFQLAFGIASGFYPKAPFEDYFNAEVI